MKISRRNFCLLMAGACCTGVLAACGSSSSSTASSSAASASATASGEVRDELIFVNYRDIRDLNPHLYAGEMYAQSILYDTLVSITADGYATTVPYCNVGLKPYEYSTETAAQILDEAGWVLGSDKMRAKDGKQLALDLLYNSDSVTEKTIAEYLQSEYLKLGISMTIHGEEEQSYRDNMKAGNFDMVFNICWGMPYDPQSSLAAMRAPVYGDYAAQQGLEDKAEIDEAITKILTSTDENERQELYKSVLTNLHEDAMYLPLTYECNKALYTSALHGVHFGTDQYDVPFADMYFE